MRCNQCAAAMINGRFCHEVGCPNWGKRYEDGRWVRYRDCRICGYAVAEFDDCSCDEEWDEYQADCELANGWESDVRD